MKMKKFIVFLFLVSLFLINEISFANLDDDNLEDGFVTINVTNIPVQLAVDTSQIIDLIPLGSKVKVIDSTDEFYEIEYKNTTGWILKNYTVEGASISIDSFTNYKQNNQPWSSIKYSEGNIGSSGCGPTSATICISGLGSKLNPGDLVQEGYKVYSSFVAGTYSNRRLLNNIGYNLSENVGATNALTYLNNGKPIICHAGPGYYTSYGHFMALIGTRGNEVYLSDPYSYKSDRNGWIDINLLMSRGVDAFYVVTKQ